MRQRGFGSQIAFAFAVVAFATAAIAAVVITATWQRQFDTYIQRGIQERAELAATAAAADYERAGGWEYMTDASAWVQTMHIGMMLGGDMRVEVLDADGNLIGSTRDQRTGMMMGEGSAEDAQVSARADVVVGDRIVGEVRVTQPAAASALTERDRWFQRASLAGLAVAALIAVGLASLAGALYARGIVRPIEAVTRVADALRRGDRNARTGMGGGDPISDLGLTFDQMADAVEAERRFEQQLTADVAHELRTPLQAIQATVEAMQDGVLPTDEERLGLIHDETMRLGRLAGSILELSRLETRAYAFESVPVDLAGPVAAAVDSLRALIDATGHTLEQSIEPGVVILGDADRLTQAVTNLVSNAARYTPAGGRIRVRVLRDGTQAVIEVADSGIGVAPADRERVFQRFWRSDPARSRASGGLGIGLAVVREIAERHGGTASAHESDLGGAAFVVRLPIALERR